MRSRDKLRPVGPLGSYADLGNLLALSETLFRNAENIFIMGTSVNSQWNGGKCQFYLNLFYLNTAFGK